MRYGTARTLSAESRTLFSHCATVLAEHIQSAPPDDRHRWCALWHLLPRMLLTQAVLHRSSRPDAARARRQFHRRRTYGPSSRPSHATCEATFRSRCQAFLTGGWAELLDIPAGCHPLTTQRSTQRLAQDVRELIWAGEFSRALSRADSAELAAATESTIAALQSLHPEDDHALSSHAPQPDLSSAFPPSASASPSPSLDRDLFHETVLRRLPRRSAADHAGWRYEHIGWMYRYLSSYHATSPSPPTSDSPPPPTPDGSTPGSPSLRTFHPGRGADALWGLVELLYAGGLPPAVRPWFLGGRLIALRKEGDSPSSRKVRPIAIGSVLARVVSMIAARQFHPQFAAQLQPPLPDEPDRPRTQPDGSPWPIQIGLTSSGLDLLVHTTSALLDTHPDWLDAACDVRNAFNALHRREFFAAIASSFPDLLPWISTMYSSPTELYFRTDDAFATILSRCGVRQGCPLGAQLFALGLHPLLCRLQRLVGTRGVVIAYADDIHILAPPAVVREALLALIATHPPPPSPPTPDFKQLDVQSLLTTSTKTVVWMKTTQGEMQYIEAPPTIAMSCYKAGRDGVGWGGR